MTGQRKRILPMLAVVSACLWASDMVLLGVWKASHPTDIGDSRL